MQESPLINQNSEIFLSQTPKTSNKHYELPRSATTLKGKLLKKTNENSSLNIIDENNESIIHTSKPFFRLANEVCINKRKLQKIFFIYFKYIIFFFIIFSIN